MDAAAELAEPRRGADDNKNQRARIFCPTAGATATPASSSRHSSQNASGRAMTGERGATGPATAASLRAAIALSAEVSGSTIQSRRWRRQHINEFEAMAECRGERSTTRVILNSRTTTASGEGAGRGDNIIPTATRRRRGRLGTVTTC